MLVPDIDFTLDIRTSSNGLLNLPDAKKCPVQSPSDVINLMLLGEKHRASSPTAMNHRSSRSHRFLSAYIFLLVILLVCCLSNIFFAIDILVFFFSAVS